MDRIHFLAAEVFSYSFANYENHLGIGHVRFEELMPRDAEILEQAERERWSDEQIAEALGIELNKVDGWRVRIRRALTIVDAKDVAEAFRNGVRYSIEDAIEKGLEDAKAVESLVTQICYRAADMAHLLEREGKSLSEYSEALRAVPESSFDESQ